MTRFPLCLTVAALAFAAPQLLLPSTATAQQAHRNARIKHPSVRMPSPSTGLFDGIYSSQSAARAAHPITQGGTTGGTVNPALTGDGTHHGYNG